MGGIILAPMRDRQGSWGGEGSESAEYDAPSPTTAATLNATGPIKSDGKQNTAQTITTRTTSTVLISIIKKQQLGDAGMTPWVNSADKLCVHVNTNYVTLNHIHAGFSDGPLLNDT